MGHSPHSPASGQTISPTLGGQPVCGRGEGAGILRSTKRTNKAFVVETTKIRATFFGAFRYSIMFLVLRYRAYLSATGYQRIRANKCASVHLF